MSRRRREEPSIDSDELVLAWTALRLVGNPPVDPKLPPHHPRSILSQRVEAAAAAAGWPPTPATKRFVLERAGHWLADLGLSEEFAAELERARRRRSRQ